MIGIIVTMHKSEKLRSNGFKLINRHINTLYKHLRKGFILYLFDNQSEETYLVPEHRNIEYEYVENQLERGVTGTWNDGVKKAITDGCDIIIITNDDIKFTNSINKFVDCIINHKHKNDSLYGCLTNGVMTRCIDQLAEKADEGIVKCNRLINGFFMGFTNEFYEKYKLPNGNLFKESKGNRWGGQENEMQRRTRCKRFIIRDCWTHHDKIRGYKQNE